MLIDNAMEAARESESGCVRVQVSEDEKGAALAVMNTYPDSLDTEAFLSGTAESTKAGHEGMGLASVEETVRKTLQMAFSAGWPAVMWNACWCGTGKVFISSHRMNDGAVPLSRGTAPKICHGSA